MEKKLSIRFQSATAAYDERANQQAPPEPCGDVCEDDLNQGSPDYELYGPKVESTPSWVNIWPYTVNVGVIKIELGFEHMNWMNGTHLRTWTSQYRRLARLGDDLQLPCQMKKWARNRVVSIVQAQADTANAPTPYKLPCTSLPKSGNATSVLLKGLLAYSTPLLSDLHFASRFIFRVL
jgi:hypothetical protein